ncbi:MAG: hypothetical protein Q4E89_02310 [Eubacteriales bacterium]|nr:hypothetical protein [Eubacteriales bacterium]
MGNGMTSWMRTTANLNTMAQAFMMKSVRNAGNSPTQAFSKWRQRHSVIAEEVTEEELRKQREELDRMASESLEEEEVQEQPPSGGKTQPSACVSSEASSINLQEAIIWAEILGEPACRKYRRRRMEMQHRHTEGEAWQLR